MDIHFVSEQTPLKKDVKPFAVHCVRDLIKLLREIDDIIFDEDDSNETRVALLGGYLWQSLPLFSQVENVSIDDAGRRFSFEIVAPTGQRMAWGNKPAQD